MCSGCNHFYKFYFTQSSQNDPAKTKITLCLLRLKALKGLPITLIIEPEVPGGLLLSGYSSLKGVLLAHFPISSPSVAFQFLHISLMAPCWLLRVTVLLSSTEGLVLATASHQRFDWLSPPYLLPQGDQFLFTELVLLLFMLRHFERHTVAFITKETCACIQRQWRIIPQ